MKKKAIKPLFVTNYLLLIFYVSWSIKEGQPTIINSIPLFISSFMLIDITYISSCNIRGSKVINLFCVLLALDSWYLLRSFEEGPIRQRVKNELPDRSFFKGQKQIPAV